MDWDPPGPKTARDQLIKDNLGCYCPKTFEMAEGKKKVAPPGVEPRASGLSCRRSVIEYVHVVGMYHIVKMLELKFVQISQMTTCFATFT